MLFWLCLIIFVLGITLLVIGNKTWNSAKGKLQKFLYWHDDTIFNTGLVVSVISGIVLFVMILVLICTYAEVDAEIAQKKETYNAIMYKTESSDCRDDFGLLSKEIVDEIQSWNEYVIFHKKMQNNFWSGIFYPDVYDQLETIDYTKYKK